MPRLLLLAPGRRCPECNARPRERSRSGEPRRLCMICRLVLFHRARQAAEERLLSATLGGPASADARHLALLDRMGRPYEDFHFRETRS